MAAPPLPPTSAPPDLARRRGPAVVTWLVCGMCVGVSIGLASEAGPETWEAFAKSTAEIREGKLWGLVTSTFVHVEVWHLAFNVYWLWVLGSRLERAIGSAAWLCFFLAAAMLSSAVQAAASGSTGIGASGVAYALFGFGWVTRERFPEFERVIDRRTALLFLVWLLACLGLSLAGVWDVGNAAHFSGLALGTGCGAWLQHGDRRTLIATGLASCFALSALGLYWAPWSSEWTSWRALRAHEAGEFETAVRWYERSLELGQNQVWCLQNLALAFHSLDDGARYQEAMRTLRDLDPPAAQEVESEIARATAASRP